MRKKSEKCAQRYLAGPKKNADRWLIEEYKITMRWNLYIDDYGWGCYD
ncbi:MAG: hypothetical protein JRD02_13090 [Deltaproteobacteria bacterium]|nr:hypothetical protein [Deltaproteobacteria bacterium]